MGDFNRNLRHLAGIFPPAGAGLDAPNSLEEVVQPVIDVFGTSRYEFFMTERVIVNSGGGGTVDVEMSEVPPDRIRIVLLADAFMASAQTLQHMVRGLRDAGGNDFRVAITSVVAVGNSEQVPFGRGPLCLPPGAVYLTRCFTVPAAIDCFCTIGFLELPLGETAFSPG